MSPNSLPASAPVRLLDQTGFVFYMLLACLVPLFFIPPSLAVLDTVASEIVFFKGVAARALCIGIFILGALRLLQDGGRAYGRAVALPLALLGGFVGVSAGSALLSDDPGFSFGHITTELALAVAVGLAPLFLSSVARVRLLLGAALAASLAAASIGLIAVAGFSGIYTVMYGADPIEVARQGLQGTMGRVEGSPLRAAMMSTFGNPEFSGTFFAGGFLLAFCWVLDGWGVRRLKTPVGWGIGVVVAALLGIAVLASQTRGALLAIAAGVLVRWLSSFRLRGWIIAAGLAAVVGSGFLFGVWGSLGMFAAGMLAAAAWQFRTGDLAGSWRAIPVRTRVLMLLVPAAFAGLLLLGLVYDPVGLRLRELLARVASSTSTADFSARQRLIFYMMAGDMLLHHPLLGIGPGFFPAQYHEALVRLVDADASGLMTYLQIELGSWVAHQAHSDYFQIAAERGVLGIGLFLGLMTAVLARLVVLVRARIPGTAETAAALTVVLCGYLSIMMTSFPLLEAGRQATFFVLLAAAFGLLAAKPEASSRAFSDQS
ncbi:MAG: O-Antigen ligase [Candidatus Sumerlaeota bacterium]|nr:O-Antigen ligase [Candidatus Sumerlaeota bacterium]